MEEGVRISELLERLSASGSEYLLVEIGGENYKMKASLLKGTKAEIRGDYWYLDGVNTNVKAKGSDGKDGTVVTIGPDGYWYLDGVKSNTKAKAENGSGGGVSSYNDLSNKPQINGHILTGNQTSQQLGLQPSGNYIQDENYVHTDNNFTTQLKQKLEDLQPGGGSGTPVQPGTIVVDKELNDTSNNPISNAAVAKALNEVGGEMTLQWKTDFETTRLQVPADKRKNGLKIKYNIQGKEWVEEFYNSSDTDDTNWAKDKNWVYEHDKGEITSLSFKPYDLRDGVFYTTKLVGEYTNFLGRGGKKNISINNNGESVLTALYDTYAEIKRVWLLKESSQDLLSSYPWMRIVKGFIKVDGRCSDSIGGSEYTLTVLRDTWVAPINNIADSVFPAIKIKEGIYTKPLTQARRILVLLNKQSLGIEFFTSPNNLLPGIIPLNIKNYYVLGILGKGYTYSNGYFPFSNGHVTRLKNGAVDDITPLPGTIELSDYTFYDIDSMVEGLSFAGECLLNLSSASVKEDNVYFLLGLKDAGTFTFEDETIGISITTEKSNTAYAIIKQAGVWSYKEVPTSSNPNPAVDDTRYTLKTGTYVVMSDDQGMRYCTHITGLVTRNDKVNNNPTIAFVGQADPEITLGSYKNVNFYGPIINDYYAYGTDFRLENCEFTAPSWRFGDSTYFLNMYSSQYSKVRYSNLTIRNCKFKFDTLYIFIHGQRFNHLEITGNDLFAEHLTHHVRVEGIKRGGLIRNNRFTNGTTGVFFASTKTFPISNVIIENNECVDQYEESISFDGIGDSGTLCPVVGNGFLKAATNEALTPDEQKHKFAKGRLVVTPVLFSKNVEGTLQQVPISSINNWTDYYFTFNRNTGVTDGIIAKIEDYDPVAGTLTLGCRIDASLILTSQINEPFTNEKVGLGNGKIKNSIVGVQSGFYDCVVRNNVIKSKRYTNATALSIYLNCFNMLVENNKIYCNKNFGNIAGGNMQGVLETLAWGNRIINNIFMNCSHGGGFSSYWDALLPQFNNVFKGNLLQNCGYFQAVGQRNFICKDNVFDKVSVCEFVECESYLPKEEDLKICHLGQIYNKYLYKQGESLIRKNFDTDTIPRKSDKMVYGIEQYRVEYSEEQQKLILKKIV